MTGYRRPRRASLTKAWARWLDRIAIYFGDLGTAQFDRPQRIRPVIRKGANGSIVIMELEKHPALHPARWNSAQWAAYEKSMVVADAINLAVEKAKAETPRQHSAREKVRLYLHTYLDLQYDTGMTVRELAKEVVKRNRRMDCVAPSDGLLVTIAEALDEFAL